MFKNAIFILLAIAASVVSTAADARPRHERQQTIITCNDRGCSDSRQAMPADSARAWTLPRGESRRSAKARRSVAAMRRHAAQDQGFVTCNDRGCSDNTAGRAAQFGMPAADTPFVEAGTRRSVRARAAYASAGVIGGRPAGCPHQFCGCEASLHVFGRIRPELNLAYNWIRYFPRTQPAPGMAAARGGHVMVLMSHVGGNDWLVHDGNSGGGLTREHVRSIAGYVIVDPHGSRSAGMAAPRRSHRYRNAAADDAFASEEQRPVAW